MRPPNPLNSSTRNLKEFEQNVSFWWNNESTLQEDNYEYDWDENHQEWKTPTSDSYRIYNDYGYDIETFHKSTNFKSWTINTYDCKD